MTEISMKQIEAFLAVAEYSSFTQAAERLFLSQSTVSAHVAALEQAFGEKLFARTGSRRVRLTPQGEKVLPLARRLLADRDALASLFADERQNEPVALGASTVPGQYVLPEALGAFMKNEPDFRYTLSLGNSAQVHEALRTGFIRIGFVGVATDDDDFEYFRLVDDQLVLTTQNNERYRKLMEQGVYGKELFGEPIIAREEGSGTERSVRAYMQSIGYPGEDLNIVARIEDPETIKRMVAQGMGVSVLSALAVEKEVGEGTLLAFEMDRAALRRGIYLITSPHIGYSRMEKRFIAFMKRRAKENA